MPNWCFNYLEVEGPYEEVERFVTEVKTEDTELSFEVHAPTDEDSIEACVDRWGTKWDACDVSMVSSNVEKTADGKGESVYIFTTAWSPPIYWLETVSVKFPTLSFVLEAEEPGVEYYAKIISTNGSQENIEYTKEEWLLERYPEFREVLKDIEGMSQDDLIRHFSGVKYFPDLFYGSGEDLPQSLIDDYEWNTIDNFCEFSPLVFKVISSIEDRNLPLFMNVDWGYDANDEFKERLKNSKIIN